MKALARLCAVAMVLVAASMVMGDPRVHNFPEWMSWAAWLRWPFALWILFQATNLWRHPDAPSRWKPAGFRRSGSTAR